MSSKQGISIPLNVEKWIITRSQLGDYLASDEGPLKRFTKQTADIDSLIEPLVIGYGDRHRVELNQLSESFYPVTGVWRIRGKASWSLRQ